MQLSRHRVLIRFKRSQKIESYNPYWNNVGKTFEDVDGYRVVIANRVWD